LRKLKKIDVNFISLVDRGANKKRLIFKRDVEPGAVFEKTLPIIKRSEEQKMVFCIVYSPDETDSQGDSAASEVIKEAAYNFMKCARTNNVDRQHDFIPDEGFVAESWIVKENDSLFPDEPAGSWAVGIKVENEDTWLLIKEGEITGVSLAGIALTEDIEKQNESLQEKVKEFFISGNPASQAGIISQAELLNKRISGALDEIKNLSEKIEYLEKENIGLSGRMEVIEKSIPESRQIKLEDSANNEKIKIWT